MGRKATLKGIIKGMNREEPCLIDATEVGLPGTNVVEYCNYNVRQAPTDLPEGHYDLIVNGKTEKVRKYRGNWLAAGM